MIRKKRILALLLSVVLGLSDHIWVNAAGIQTEPSGQEHQVNYGELLEQVTDLYEKKQLKLGTGQPDTSFVTGVLLVGSNEPDFDKSGAERAIEASPGLYVLSYPTPADAKAAYDTYSQMDGILFVEPDTVIGMQEEEQIPTETEPAAVETETETATEQQTPDTQTSADELPGQTPARIAVVDTGIDVTMEKAQPYLTGYNRESILAKLRQFFGGEPDTEGFVSEEEVRDENGHGSQVTGLIADALAGDGIGGDQAEILPVKVAGADGRCTVLQLYLGIERAIALQSDLINVSMGAFATTESAVLTKAADDAAKAGITMVVSAGNNGSDVASYAPANIPSVITAGSIDRNSQASDFSNHGETMDCVSYGEDLVVTGISGQSETVSGTSYAAALVTAELAKQAVHTGKAGAAFTPELADAYISQNAVDLGDPGWDAWYGYGLIGSYEYQEEPVDADTEEVTEETETGTEDTEEPATEEADSVIQAPDNATGRYPDSGQLTEDEKREMHACLSFGDIGNDINCIAETENIYAASVLAGQVKEKAKAIGDEIRAGYVTSRYFDGNGFVSPVSYHKTGMEQTDAAGEELMQTLLAYGKSGSVEDEEKFEAAFDKFYHTLNAEKEPQAQAQSAELTGMLVTADEKAEQTQAEEAAQEEAAAEADTGSVDASVQSKTDVDGQADEQADPVDDTSSVKTERIGELAADDLYGRLMAYPKEKLKQFYEGLSDSDSELLVGRLGARYQEVMERIYAPEVSVQSAGEEVRYVGDEASLRMYADDTGAGTVAVQGMEYENKHGTLNVTGNVTLHKYYSTNGNLTITSSNGSSLILGSEFRDQSESMIYTYSNTVTIKGNVVLDGRNIPHNGFFVWNNGTLNIEGSCVFKNHYFHNTSGTNPSPKVNGGYGSAVHNEGTCNISGGTFQGNYIENRTAPGGGGGAVASLGKLTVTGGTMKNNAGSSGGAIWVYGGTAVISKADIYDNLGEYGTINITGSFWQTDADKEKHKEKAVCTLSGTSGGKVKIHGEKYSSGIHVSQGGKLVVSTAHNYIYGNKDAGIRNTYTTQITGASKIGFSAYTKIDDYTASENEGGALVNSDQCTVSEAARFFGGTKTAISNSGTMTVAAKSDAVALGTTAGTVVNNSGTFTAAGKDGSYSLSVFSASSTYGVKNTGKMSFGGCVDGRYKVTTSARGSTTPVEDKNKKKTANHAFTNACILNDSTAEISGKTPYALKVCGDYVARNGSNGVKVNKGKAQMTSGTVTANENNGFYIASGASGDIEKGTFTSNGTNGVNNAGTCSLTGDNIYSYSNKNNGLYNTGTMNITGKVKSGFSKFTDNTDYALAANTSSAARNAGGTLNISARVYFYGGDKSALTNSGTCTASEGWYVSKGATDCVYNNNSLTMSDALVLGAAANGIRNEANDNTKVNVTATLTDTEVRGQYTVGDTAWKADNATHNFTTGINNGAGTMTVSGGVVRNASGNGIANSSGATVNIGAVYIHNNNGNGISNAGTGNITGNAKIGFSAYKSMDYTADTKAGTDSGYVTSKNGDDAVKNTGTMTVSGAVRLYTEGKPAVSNSGTFTFQQNADACLLAKTDGNVIENSGTMTAEAKDATDKNAKPACTIFGNAASSTGKICGISNTGTLNWGGKLDGSFKVDENGRTSDKKNPYHNITTGINNNSSKQDKKDNEIATFSLYDNALITNCGTGIYAKKGKAVLKAAEIENCIAHGIENRAAAQTHINGTDIHDNTNADGSGAGIYNLGKLYLNSGSVRNNKAHTYGGGIMNKAGADFRMNGGTIYGNKCRWNIADNKEDTSEEAKGAGGGIHNETADAANGAGELRLYGGYIHGNSNYGISNRGKTYIATQDTPSDNKDIRFHMGVSAYSSWQSYTPSANAKGNIYNEGLLWFGKAGAKHTYARLVSDTNVNIYNTVKGTVDVLENTATTDQTELYGTGTGICNDGGTVNLRTGLNITSPSAQARVGIVNMVHKNSDKSETVGTVNVAGGTIEKGSTGINNAGTVTMSKGTISENSVTGVSNDGTFTLTGGTINKNTGHGVTQNGTFNMSGAAAVDTSNDVCLAYGKVITVKDRLTTSGEVAKVTPVNKADANDDSAIVLTGKGTVIAKTSYSGGKGSAALFYDNKQSARFILSNGGILRPGDYMDQDVLKEAKKSVAATDIAISEKYGITYDKNLDGIPVSIPKDQSKFWCENVKLVMANPTITDAARAPEFQFLHWNDKADDTGSIYVNGQTYKKNNSVTIYAQWQNNINFAYIGNEQEQGNDYTDKLISQSEEYTFGDNQDDAGNEYFDKTAIKSYTDEETGSEVEQEVECTVVGWRLGNNINYDSYQLGQNENAGDIYETANEIPEAISYGTPNSDYGSHNPVNPFQLVTPAGNGQAVAGTLTGAESITQKNFLSPFVGGIPYINLYAVWDEGPVVEAYDLYYDLSFAQSTTDTEGITMAELLSHAEARDVEDGTLAPGADIDIGDGKKTSFVVMDYQISDFTGFTTDGTVSVTYQATDSAGNVTRKRINVHVIDTTPQDVKEGKVRFISNKYLDKSEADGGLAADSVWNTRSDYHDLLATVLSNEKTGVETADGHYFGQDISIEKPGSGTWIIAPEETWEFTHEQVQAVKAYIDANGIGNSKSDTALSSFTSSFASCKK